MRLLSLAQLIFLAAIWGSSFLFMRVVAPEFGPIALMLVRVGGAALCLSPLFVQRAVRQAFVREWKKFLVVGAFSSALPFCLLTFATLFLEAGITSLLNATTPFFAGVIGWIWLGARLQIVQWAGIALGVAGITLLSRDYLDLQQQGALLAVLAGLAAGAFYGFGAHFTRKFLSHLPPLTVAVGTLSAATLALFPFGLWQWPSEAPSGQSWVMALLLAAFCTALALYLYFTLLAREGAQTASTVTFIIPLFAVGWGALFLDERLSSLEWVGMGVTLIGTVLTLNLVKIPGTVQEAGSHDLQQKE